ncbi:hypothetical protein MMC12_007467 [Toensbergia leucococca]|nr:hypothetical protein [Toensbergia leucococca]
MARSSVYCVNAPGVIAGTLVKSTHTRHSNPRSSITSLKPRYQGTASVWCKLGSETFVVYQTAQLITQASIITVLNIAFNAAESHVNAFNNEIDNGQVSFVSSDGLIFVAYSNVSHDLTWDVLRNAIMIISDYMSENRVWSASNFHIFDGSEEVGRGYIDGP